ncbi:MAG: hypothetical protein KatS3mg129_2266 [Leptospiraceae bacterium]|nr:MAG: hypothetical protein KatS3mg129_2266 [Leptospiraceae bacterium]
MNEKIIHKKKGNLNYYINLENKKFIILNQKLIEEDIERLIINKGRAFPFILFVGSDIELMFDHNENLQLFHVKKRFIEIFYKLKNDKNTYRVSIKINVNMEYFPVYILHIQEIKEIEKLDYKKFFDIIILSPKLNRLDILQIKIHFPKVMLVKAGSYIPEQIKEPEELENYRITDIVNKFGTELISKNPVYSARYYLRKLDFENLYEIPLKIKCLDNDIEVILTYLDIMYKNEHKSKDLEINKENILLLKKYYEYIYYILKRDYTQLERIYSEDENILKREIIRENLIKFIKKYKETQEKKLSKEDEIQLWELETLLQLKESNK